MNNRFLWFLLMLFSLSCGMFVSCKDDDDDDAVSLNYDDPRVRVMTINGISATFVVNDVESLIYNYDSLSFGTDVKRLHPVFSGYQVSPIMQYDSAGTWKSYPSDTTFKLDFSNVVKFRSISLDSLHTKVYTVELRVHEYDVESYEWELASTLPVHGDVVTQKAVSFGGKYYFFYSNGAGENYALSSSDCKSWKEEGSIVMAGADWHTLTERNGSLVVNTANGLYVCTSELSFIPSSALLPANLSMVKPLFTLGAKFWVVAEDVDGKKSLCSLAAGSQNYEVEDPLPSTFVVEGMEAVVSPSGSTLVGYLFTSDGQGGTAIWALDNVGNLMCLSNGKSPFDFRFGMMAYYYDKTLCVIGGQDAAGNYQGTLYKSTDSGMRWGYDSHKIFPNEEEYRAYSSILFNEDTNEVFMIGGKNKSGFAPGVWKGILKQFLMDDLIYGNS